jgi:hypothetical protein
MYTYKIYLLPLFVLLTALLAHSTVFAIGTIDIERGETVSIGWNVSGDPNCEGGFGTPTYPDNSPYDTAQDVWYGYVTPSPTGSLTLGSFIGNTGLPFSPAQSYIFTCESGSGAKDSSTVNIHECSTVSTSGTTWNGTARRCMYPDLSVTNSGPLAGASFIENQSITFTGVAVASSSAPASQGGWADVEIDWNSDGINHDVNYNAYSGNKLGSFSVGQSKNLSYTLSAPLPIGTHRYRFNVDTVNELNEGGYEANNRSAWISFTVVGAVTGSCGAAVKTYAANETAYTGAYCASGAVSPVAPAFPQEGLSGSWTCTGNTGAPASCIAPRQPNPPAPAVSCNAAGTQATFSWGGVTNVTSYGVRLNDPTNDSGACAGGWLCPASEDHSNDSVVALSYPRTITPDKTYNFWMHSIGQNGVWSSAASVPVNCPSPKPDLVATTPTAPAGDSQKGLAANFATGNIVNQGNLDAGPYTITYHIDKAPISGVADTTGTVSVAGATTIGASQNIPFTWTPGASDPAGTYQVRYEVNQPRTLTESDYTDNISAWRQFNVIEAYQCGPAPIPANASEWDVEERTSLSAAKAWEYAASDTGTKCQFQCNANFFWDGDSCDKPNLTIVSGPSLLSGNERQGEDVSFTTRIQNNSTVSIPVAFFDRYEYRWGNTGAFRQFGGDVANGILAAGATADNASPSTLRLTQSGLLQIQYCVDGSGLIDESDESVADQCETKDFSVTPAPTITLFQVCAGSNCANMGGTLTGVEPDAALTVEWDADHADSCSRVSGNGFDIIGGVLSGTDPANAFNESDKSDLYRIVCTKAGFAPIDAQVTVETRTVNVNLRAEPNLVDVDNSVKLIWSTDGIDEAQCQIQGGGLTISGAEMKANTTAAFAGEKTVLNIKGRTLFTLSCLSESAVEYETVELIPERDDG